MLHQLIHLAIEVEQMLGLPAALCVGWLARGRSRASKRVKTHPVGAVRLLEVIEERGVHVPLAVWTAASGISLQDLMRSTH